MHTCSSASAQLAGKHSEVIPTVHWILGLVSGGCDEWYRMRAEEGGQLQIAQFQAVTECGKLKKNTYQSFSVIRMKSLHGRESLLHPLSVVRGVGSMVWLSE